MTQTGQCIDSSENYYLAQIERKTLLKAIPLRSIFEITYRCNFRCVHCYVVASTQTEELSTCSAKEVIDKLAEAGCLTITFSGGEPLLRRDFSEIAHHARKKRFAVRLFTNGSLIDEGIADEIKSIRPLSIDISLYGSNEETYRKITGNGKHFSAVVQGVEHLKKRGLNLILKFPLMKENMADLKEMKRIAREWDLKYKADPHLTPRDNGCQTPLKHLIDDDSLMRYIKEDLGPPPVIRRDPDDIICTVGRNNIAISPYGDVYPCVQLKKTVGNIFQGSLTQLWRDSDLLHRLRSLRFRDFTSCIDCDFVQHCFICPGVAMLESDNPASSYSYGCKFAPLVAQSVRKGTLEQDVHA